MKLSFKLLPAFAILGALVWAGCQTQYPTSYSHLTSTGSLVVNFEGANPLNVNPGLAEANRPNNMVIIPGAVAITLPPSGYGSGGSAVVSPGAANTAHCFQTFGTVIDKGDNKYPSIQIQIPLEKSASVSAFYDAELFQGVKFYIKVMGDDTAGTRTFSIPVAQTMPPSNGGNCNPNAASNACYNNFAVSYANTNGNWVLVSSGFSAFTRGNYGAAISPTTLSGANLQQILMLQWGEGNQNVAGTANIDFYIDEVEFY
jgi:hypothetical protein